MLDSIKPTGEDLEIIRGFIKGPEIKPKSEEEDKEEELNEEKMKEILKSMNETQVTEGDSEISAEDVMLEIP